MWVVGFRLGSSEVENGRRLLRILGDVYKHRPGPARTSNLKGVSNRRRDILWTADQEIVLRDRQSDAGDIDLLECIRAQHLTGNVARNADDRNRVQHCCCDTCDQVRCSGPARGERDADLARCASVAIGHVCRALFMPHQDVMNGKLAQRVVNRKDRSAGIAEDIRNALTYKRRPHDLCTGEGSWCGEVRICGLATRTVSHG